MTAIKAYLSQYEIYLWAAAAFLLLCGLVYTVKHLEDIGVQRQQAADAKLAAAQVVHKEEVEKRAQELNQAAGSELHAALVAPSPNPAITVRVCPSTPAPRPVVSANGGSVTGSISRQPQLPGSVGSSSTGAGMDIAPGTEGLLSRCQAEVTYWRQYYAACKAEGACK